MLHKNPRGIERPKDGRGKGIGVSGGQRSGKNSGGCSKRNAGKGLGQGKGLNRKG